MRPSEEPGPSSTETGGGQTADQPVPIAGPPKYWLLARLWLSSSISLRCRVEVVERSSPRTTWSSLFTLPRLLCIHLKWKGQPPPLVPSPPSLSSRFLSASSTKVLSPVFSSNATSTNLCLVRNGWRCGHIVARNRSCQLLFYTIPLAYHVLILLPVHCPSGCTWTTMNRLTKACNWSCEILCASVGRRWYTSCKHLHGCQASYSPGSPAGIEETRHGYVSTWQFYRLEQMANHFVSFVGNRGFQKMVFSGILGSCFWTQTGMHYWVNKCKQKGSKMVPEKWEGESRTITIRVCVWSYGQRALSIATHVWFGSAKRPMVVLEGVIICVD